MSKISKEGFEQIQIIKNALDSMFDKLDTTVYTKMVLNMHQKMYLMM